MCVYEVEINLVLLNHIMGGPMNPISKIAMASFSWKIESLDRMHGYSIRDATTIECVTVSICPQSTQGKITPITEQRVLSDQAGGVRIVWP